MVGRPTGSDSRRAAARLVVLWPFLVTVGFPAFVLVFGLPVGYLFGLALVAGATLLFARFGLLGLASAPCFDCGGSATVGQLYCPHCGSLHERIHAPLLQGFTALVLPVWFLIAESFLVTVVGALSSLVPVVRPFAEQYRAFAFGVEGSILWVLVATAVAPFVLTTLARVALRGRDARASVRSEPRR